MNRYDARETANQLRKHLRSLRGTSTIRLHPVAIRDVRSFTLTDPSPSRGCLCKTVADKRGDPRDRSVMEPLDASKTSVTHRGRCYRTGYGLDGSFGGAFVGEKGRD